MVERFLAYPERNTHRLRFSDHVKMFADGGFFSGDGGLTWFLAGRPLFPGAVYGAAYMPRSPSPTVLAVGPAGDFVIDWRSRDVRDRHGPRQRTGATLLRVPLLRR